MTTKLVPEAYLSAALTGIGVLRTLNELDVKMPHKEFLTAIGVFGKTDQWQGDHRKWAIDILDIMAAVEKLDGDKETLRYDRIINARTGKAGSGVNKISRIISTRPNSTSPRKTPAPKREPAPT